MRQYLQERSVKLAGYDDNTKQWWLQSFTNPAFVVPTNAVVLFAGIHIFYGMRLHQGSLSACNPRPFLQGVRLLHSGTCVACAAHSTYKEGLTKTNTDCYVHELEFHVLPDNPGAKFLLYLNTLTAA
jgi:hypothetical protein